MKNVQFLGTFGDELLPVDISQVSGTNGLYHVLINKFYQGMVVQTQTGEWISYIDLRYISHGDDITIIIDIVKTMAEGIDDNSV